MKPGDIFVFTENTRYNKKSDRESDESIEKFIGKSFIVSKSKESICTECYFLFEPICLLNKNNSGCLVNDNNDIVFNKHFIEITNLL